ncbi:MAG: DEAD/DEAH box helicase [Cyclonatronaceae bacterium]
MLFKELNLCEEVLNGIGDMGFDSATEIQEKAIPIALEGKNLLGTSYTGSGKTAAFVIPILHKLFTSKKEGIQALVLAPTRELAQQIDEQFFSLGYHTGISSVCVYGGSDWSQQEKAMKAGVNVIVATPGRMLDQMKITSYDFSNIDVLVLDEADRMLDMGFLPDVRSIINRIPKKRQTLLFSATVTPRIEKIAKEFTDGSFERIKVGQIAPAKGIEQVYYKVGDRQKQQLLLQLYEEQKWHSAIVFASTKRGVDSLGRSLQKKGVEVDSIHGDRTQKEREHTLEAFRARKIKVLVATDVMARGIDVDDISHIINYDVPNDADDYIHRIGRTARAESTGHAITFVSRKDWPDMRQILDGADLDIKEMPLPEGIEQDDGSGDSRSSRGRGRSSSGGGSRSGGKNRSGRGSSKNSAASDKRDPNDSRNTSKKEPAEPEASSSAGDASAKAAPGETSDTSAGSSPKRRSRGRRKAGGRKPSTEGSSSPADQKKEESSGESSKPKSQKSRQNRKKRSRTQANAKNKKPGQTEDKKSKPRRGLRSDKSSPAKSGSKPADKAPASPKKQYLQEQQEKIKQVQQSSIPEPGPDADSQAAARNKKASGKQKGIWKKLKNIFQ